ncbi:MULTISPECIES: phosphoenolpyruvate--protein phosphotransferase [Nocardioides]|uniref:phosphoenolpyruvate--protein phosphotransferase n=1 Tax=Nocardioides TaxID=1839 RepID=UPI000703B4E2|nr:MULTISPECIES: phosphoenolpyruvate--protein phosphotransferase [unclassified Nocardioides]KQP67159.1 phosphoenolpyruvate-protein phosphotransferase [Nocardioides sp. Leaf285]KQQ41621.1 phosphoenolpyruvate-protein phosphotransferase [Nocardioides sp. Leaf307]MCM3514138.1 phosphoenolpyruvate--protein phosphotransferase [Nocardioides sp. P86]
MVTQTSTDQLLGTPVVPGLATGPALVVRSEISPAAIEAFDGASLDEEAALRAYDDAAGAVAAGFERRAGSAHGAAAEVLTASAGLARDKGLRIAVRKHLRSGEDLLSALAAGVEQFVGVFTQMGGLMAERVTDLRDIERRVLAHLVGEPEPGVPTPQEPSVLVAEDLAPSDTAGLDPTVVVALVTERGGPTSHTAIIARQLGIPCVVGTAGAMGLRSGTRLLVDGSTGVVELDPDEADTARRVAADREVRAAVEGWTGPGRTTDGTSVKILANVADGESAAGAATGPVEGVGLFRTELCFLNRTEEPSVEEQADIYSDVLSPFSGERYVVVRTLDAGSDKPVAFATHDGEENPALGVRGLRLSFDNPGLLERQLDGIAAAAERTGTETWVMAPMVATVAEAAGFAEAVRSRGLKAGVMVEVPSAALLAHRMLEVVDFLSIGTNDLTQYAMAADRMATDLAHLTDPWQPAVLQLIAITAHAGQEAGKPVGVCGEAAADPLLACALVGMGVTSLSMASAAVRSVGARLGTVSMATCEEAAEAALSAPDPQAARAAVLALLEG